ALRVVEPLRLATVWREGQPLWPVPVMMDLDSAFRAEDEPNADRAGLDGHAKRRHRSGWIRQSDRVLLIDIRLAQRGHAGDGVGRAKHHRGERYRVDTTIEQRAAAQIRIE